MRDPTIKTIIHCIHYLTHLFCFSPAQHGNRFDFVTQTVVLDIGISENFELNQMTNEQISSHLQEFDADGGPFSLLKAAYTSVVSTVFSGRET